MTRKNIEILLDAVETYLGYFGFDITVDRNMENADTRKWNWLEKLRQEKEKDVKIEMI